ncbi:hypothetical protein GCM10022261_13300 [Brevibacterium daeguense]|uniref:DUF4352 domain-containing protein n=2 Tax=Brevibacterium daeguense TaxID=909936 RepID=A0ABP8EIM2_9MICO
MVCRGEWVLYRTIDSESIIHDWSLRIDSAEVTDSIEGAADNPEYYSGENYDAPERITAEAKEGMELLHVVYTARNDGMEPGGLPVTYAVIFSDGEVFAPTGDDDDYGYNLTLNRDPAAGQSQQNPHSEAQGDIVIEIPADSELAAVEFCDPYIDSGFCTTIELTDVD